MTKTQPPPLIACFDLASRAGGCDGVAGGVPRFWSWDLYDAGPFRAPRFAMLETLLHNYFHEMSSAGTPVQQAYYEAPQPIQVMARIGTTDDTITQLRGFCAITELVCLKHKIPCGAWEAKDAREVVVGQRTFKSIKTERVVDGVVKTRKISGAKPAVVAACRDMGYAVENDNEADALVGWLYQSSLITPHFSDSMMPLFRRGA